MIGASGKAAKYKKVRGQIFEVEPPKLSTLRRDFARVVKATRAAEMTRREAWLNRVREKQLEDS
jgi:hypothetical protein